MDTAIVTIQAYSPIVNPSWYIDLLPDSCNGTISVHAGFSGINATEVSWNNGNGQTVFAEQVNFMYNIPGQYIIYMEASNPSCDQAFSFEQEIILDEAISTDSQFELPNIFSPNDDELNEYWPDNLSQQEFQHFSSWNLNVYNRNGALVFQSGHPSLAWDGMISNDPAAEGTYFYTLEYSDVCAQEEIKFRSGYFLLIR
jgi:gliding motility-associated-like protein